ncbi:MAG: protease HtpX [Succinimonas sp.]|nr:protease HtpX [Succinimonas sp.]
MVGVLAYIGTLVCVMLVVAVGISIIETLLGIEPGESELLFVVGLSLVFGMTSSLVSLFLSKWIIKQSYNLTPITNPRDDVERWLLDTVTRLAQMKHIGMPEVCIYQSNDMNAFATGWNKNHALVAVSSALLRNMSEDEAEAVLGHELSHVENGDMVTMCLIQGIMNAFVYFIAFIVARAIASRINNKGAYFLVFHLVRNIALVTMGFLGQLVVLMFSRWREFRADAGSADILGAEPMIKALETLKAGYAIDRQNVIDNRDPVSNSNTSMLCISDREMAGIFGDWRKSHPSLQKRIEVLKERSR